MVLPISVEDHRGHSRNEEPAEHSPRSNHEVKQGQVRRIGPRAVEFAVARHAAGKHGRGVGQNLDPKWYEYTSKQDCRGHDRRNSHQQSEVETAVPSLMLECNDERGQIKRQRHHPKKRRHRNFLRHLVRRCQQHDRPSRGETQPHENVECRRCRPSDSEVAHSRSSRATRGHCHRSPGTPNAQKHKKPVGHRPRPNLTPERKCRFDDKRIGQQSQQRTCVRKRIQPIGRVIRIGQAEPMLHQGRRRRKKKVRYAYIRQEQPKDERGRLNNIRTLPERRLGRDRQKQQRNQQDGDVDAAAGRPREACADEVSISVTAEQDDLEEQHAGRPDRRTAAEPWQDDLGDERLNLKEQESAEKDRDRKAKHQQKPSNSKRRGTEVDVRLFPMCDGGPAGVGPRLPQTIRVCCGEIGSFYLSARLGSLALPS